MAAITPYPQGTCAGPWTGSIISTTYDVDYYHVARVPAVLPESPPPLPERFRAAMRTLPMRSQVAGVCRFLRFLQGPLCRGGTK